jgi:uncharacterized membrane protein (DUF4010 family)
MASGLVVAVAARLSLRRPSPLPVAARKLIPKRPFEPLAALRFVALLTAVVLAAAIAKTYLGNASLPWVLTASGLVDVHAAAASAAQTATRVPGQAAWAELGLSGAFIANSLVKCLVAAVKGSRRFALRLIPGILAMAATFAAVAAFG